MKTKYACTWKPNKNGLKLSKTYRKFQNNMKNHPMSLNNYRANFWKKNRSLYSKQIFKSVG
jgi:hypothetical protein